eukprot:s129_g26.t1
MDLHFVWQAWHLATWTFRHGPSLCVAGVALMALSWLWVTWVPCDAAVFCVAGVALGDMHLHFARQAWHLATWTFTFWGRRGAYGTQLALVTRLVPEGAVLLCVAGAAFGDIDLHFVWQAWHLATWTFSSGVALMALRRGIWRHPPSLCVAGVAFGGIDLHFVWLAWHLATWTFTLCGRRGTYGTQLALARNGRKRAKEQTGAHNRKTRYVRSSKEDVVQRSIKDVSKCKKTLCNVASKM